jgi:hypothetical protein
MSTNKIDRIWDAVDAPWIVSYVVRITNGTQATLPMVHLLAARSLRPTILHHVPNLAPGATVALPVGTVHDLGWYYIAAFDAQGHMIARIPLDSNPVNPSKYPAEFPADAAAMLPLRINDHTDEWVITESHLLNALDQYTVEIINQTSDTWEEVTIFFANGITGITEGFTTSAVLPEGRVRIGLCPAGAMNGYVFAIWVGGLRAELSPGQLQFPAEGLMTAERSAELRGEMNPSNDQWTIGVES